MTRPEFSGYEIFQEVEGGNFGSMYKAYSSKLSKTVAIKVLPAHLAKDERVVERFRREAETLQKMDHPGIVRLFEYGSIPVHYIALEWLDGMTMEKDIETREVLPAEEEFVRVFKACVEGLAYAHQRGVVHRDLSPANVFFTLDRETKLVDFGLAKILTDATLSRTGEIIGSAPYMSPEQFQDSSRIDHQSDIFGLGAVGYRYATGQFPHGSDNPMAILKRMADSTYQITPPLVFNRNISVKTDSILRKCLERDIRRRYQSVEGILTDLKYGDPDEPVAGYAQASVATPAREAPAIHIRRKKISWVAVMAGACIVSAILAGVGLYSGGRRRPQPNSGATPAVSKDNPFKGRRVLILGRLPSLTHDEAGAAIDRLGGIPAKNVTRQTNLVVIGEDPGSRQGKAREYGIPAMSGDEFEKLLAQLHMLPKGAR